MTINTNNTMAGQISSHFVYSSPSECWQHLEGQAPGHTQQQSRHDHKVKLRINPMRNGPTVMPRPIPKFVKLESMVGSTIIIAPRLNDKRL